MSFRPCVYKNCGNFINLRDRTINDVKLFGFPKNPERRQKWIELGNVSPSLQESAYFFCSDHFDKKFMAVNNRRTVLVGEAVPFPYVETEIVGFNADEDDLTNYMYSMDRSNYIEGKNDYSHEQDIIVESTTVTSEIKENLHDETFSNDLDKHQDNEFIALPNDEKNIEESTIRNEYKRKLDNAVLHASSSNTKIVKTSQQVSSNQNISTVAPIKDNSLSNKEQFDDDINIEELVDAQHVTTFIFKGEEYVQMPKEHYVNEKINLMKKLKKLKKALKIIKGHLNTLEV